MKKFIVIGNMNALRYKDVFSYVKNKVVLEGYTHIHNNEPHFYFEDGCGNIMAVDISRWITNIAGTRDKTIRYVDKDISEYRKYDDYDVIEVGSVRDIPDNYYGVMGLSVCIFDWNLDEYDIMGKIAPKIDGISLFNRILIKRKNKYVK